MGRTLAVVILTACVGCKSASNFWRPKPDNHARRSMDYTKAETGFFEPGFERGALGLNRDPNAGGLPVIR
jgi:hypothetical protein